MKIPSERLSSFIIIEDFYLQTFIHSLVYNIQAEYTA